MNDEELGKESLYICLENNVIVMFIVGASTTHFWLLLRKYLPRSLSEY